MNKNNIIIIGIASIIVISLVIINTNSDTKLEKKSYCMTDEQFEAAFPERFNPDLRDDIILPTYIPEGYTFVCKHVSPMQIFFIYSKEPIQTADFEELLRVHDAILLTINDETQQNSTKPLPPEERIKVNISKERMEVMKARYLTINGYPAFGREAGDYGTLGSRYSNGTIISMNSTYEPARLRIAIGDLDYIITGYKPLDMLIKMAESMS
jgi:hypothetical protein